MPKRSTEPTDFERELLQLASAVETNDDIGEYPMIIMGSHNPNILVEYRVVHKPNPKREPDVDVKPLLDEEAAQTHLERIVEYRERFKTLLWETLVPALAGFNMANDDVTTEVRELFGRDVVIQLTPYQRALKDVAFAACVQKVAEMFSVSSEHAALVIRSKLDEASQRSRPNAGNVQRDERGSFGAQPPGHNPAFRS